MKKLAVPVLSCLFLLVFPAVPLAVTTYTGYSGAPGSSGTCASSCHGSGVGTVEISGFPAEYVPGEVYTVTISHNGGSSIRQFNGSCRVGTGSQNAGVIAAGTSTVTYSKVGETNGVHFAGQSLNSGTFLWTAPPSGTGMVRLYVGAHQGTEGGANTTIVKSATEATTGVLDGTSWIPVGVLTDNFPNPFGVETTIRYALAQPAPVSLDIYSVSGRLLESFSADQSAGYHQYTWSPVGIPSGVYFYRIRVGDRSETRKMILAR